MGLFSSIGNIFSGATKALTSFISPVADFIAPVAKAVGAVGTGYQAYNALSSRGNQQTNDAIYAQIQGQKETNAQALAEAQRNREFQERLSNTAHQREMDDLRRSGLNPILTATGGNGASSAAGNMANLENPWKGTAAEVNAARKIQEVEKQRNFMELMRLQNETAMTQSNISLNEQKEQYTMDAARAQRADADLKWNAQGLQNRQGENYVALTRKLEKDIEHLASQINLNSAYGRKTLVEAMFREIEAKKAQRDYDEKAWGSDWRKFLNPTKAVIDTFNPLQGLMP